MSQNCAGMVQSQGQYQDGVYEGEGMGYNGKIQVEVSISSGNMEIVNYVDDEHFFCQVADALSQAK